MLPNKTLKNHLHTDLDIPSIVWCQAELTRASEQGTPIIPILVRPISGDDYGIVAKIQVGSQTLSDTQYRDFTQGYDQGLAVLLTDIQKHTN